MPLERVSQGFKDISMSFENNPLTQDLIALKNENAIARSIKRRPSCICCRSISCVRFWSGLDLAT